MRIYGILYENVQKFGEEAIFCNLNELSGVIRTPEYNRVVIIFCIIDETKAVLCNSFTR